MNGPSLTEQVRTIRHNFTALPEVICPGELLLHHAMLEDTDREYALKARHIDCPACGAPAGVNCRPTAADKPWNHPEREHRQYVRETLFAR